MCIPSTVMTIFSKSSNEEPTRRQLCASARCIASSSRMLSHGAHEGLPSAGVQAVARGGGTEPADAAARDPQDPPIRHHVPIPDMPGPVWCALGSASETLGHSACLSMLSQVSLTRACQPRLTPSSNHTPAFCLPYCPRLVTSSKQWICACAGCVTVRNDSMALLAASGLRLQELTVGANAVWAVTKPRLTNLVGIAAVCHGVPSMGGPELRGWVETESTSLATLPVDLPGRTDSVWSCC